MCQAPGRIADPNPGGRDQIGHIPSLVELALEFHAPCPPAALGAASAQALRGSQPRCAANARGNTSPATPPCNPQNHSGFQSVSTSRIPSRERMNCGDERAGAAGAMSRGTTLAEAEVRFRQTEIT